MTHEIVTEVTADAIYRYHRGQMLRYSFLSVALTSFALAGSFGYMKGITHTDPRDVCAPQDDACYVDVQRSVYQNGAFSGAFLVFMAGAAGMAARDEYAKAKRAKAALPKSRI